ncbi:MAG: Fic family protein [Clostridia bacterium]|nr:Fic family protein [Clostridia bacterium]
MKSKNLEEALELWNSMLPLSEHDKQRLDRRFTVDFNYNSNHIEGNTLTYGQTELLLFFGKVNGVAKLKDCEEMKASDVCLKLSLAESQEKSFPLTQNFIRQLHRTLLREDYQIHYTRPDGTASSYTIHAGQYKTRPNSVVTRYGDIFTYASPEETPSLMSDLVDWYNMIEEEGSLSPVDMAILFHYRYIRIHPFEDGNGRIARLMVNYILAKHGYPLLVVRSRKKDDYLEALHEADLNVGPALSDGARATLRQIRPFRNYFRKMYASEIMYNVQFITEQGKGIWWFDGERIQFRSENSSKILNLLADNPDITYDALKKKIGINMSAIQKQLKSMMDKGYIVRTENGEWRVIITQ